MAQNIYDDPEFFEAFRQLKKSSEKHGLIGGSTNIEELAKLLPVVTGLTILDLGCGDGWFSHWALTEGAAATHGIDVSASQLELAQAGADSLKVSGTATWERGDLDEMQLPADKYDLVFSSLALHYVKDPKEVLVKIAAALKPGGKVFFSVEHPIYTAPRRRETCEGPDGTWQRHWPLHEYFDEGERTHFWLGKDVEKAHWTLQTWMNTILDAGMTVVHYHEWIRPQDKNFQTQKWWMGKDIGPSFLMLGGRKDA